MATGQKVFSVRGDSLCKGPGVESRWHVQEYQEGCVMKWVEWEGGM